MEEKNEGKKRDLEFEETCRQMVELHEKKNADYGNAFSDAYRKCGNGYAVGLLYNKVSRLVSLLCSDKIQWVNEESVDDTLIDIANYAVMLKCERAKQRSVNAIRFGTDANRDLLDHDPHMVGFLK